MKKGVWLDSKPDFKTECSFVTASVYNRNTEPILWGYQSWSIKLLLGENEAGDAAWYLGLLNGDGEEWGALDELAADKYFILPEIKK